MMTFRPNLLSTLAAATALGALTPVCAAAQPSAQRAETVMFNIPAGPLDQALMAFIAQSRVQILYRSELAAGQGTEGLQGRHSIAEGLAKLLASSTLQAQAAPSGVFILQPRGAMPQNAPRPAASDRAPHTLSEAAIPTAAHRSDQLAGLVEPAMVDELVVTGSHIRGAGQGPSPVVQLDRASLERTGRGTLAEALSDLPQVFNSSATPATNLTGSDRSGSNAIVAQGINLRGLGPSATLVLVNGRRMAGAGLTGDFADVSAIPAAAVERVEVLLDGASAIYGSDAVGGVVNIILRRDFEGAESRLRLGGAQDGAGEQQASHTLGRAWTGGQGLVSYEFHRSEALSAATRSASASADLRRLGGRDWRQFYATPGNIMAPDAATGAYLPVWAITPGPIGWAQAPGDFSSTQVNLGDQRRQTDILPRQERHSLYAQVSQAFAPWLGGQFELRYSHRDFAYATSGPVALLTVTRANPFFVSPTGADRHQVAYNFTEELGPTRSAGSSESLGVNLGFEADIGASWRLEGYGAYAAEASQRGEERRLNSRYLQEALGTIADDPTTAYVAARDGYFNPFGSGQANGDAVLNFIGSGFSQSIYDSQVATFNLQADGEVIGLPGGPLLAAVGVQQRHERFIVRSTSAVSRTTATVRTEGPYERSVTAAFLELRAPLIEADPNRLGLTRLELTAAGRIERHSDVGESRTPKLGVLWAPHRDLLARVSYGTSFRAPALSQVYEPQDAGPAILPEGDQQRLVLLRVGGNLDLEPETARTWTVGIDYAPEAWPGWRLSLGGFQVEFENQIGRPIADDIYNALSNPIYASFIRRLDPSRPADLAAVSDLLTRSPSGSPDLFPPAAYSAIVDTRQVNTGGLYVRGIDIDARGSMRQGEHRLDLRLSGVWLIDYERVITPTAPAVELVGRAGQPPRLKGQLGLDWSRGPLALGLSVNYLDEFADLDGRKIEPWTTADVRAAWRPDDAGWRNGLEVSVSVRNLFDADAPFYDNPQGIGYDPANADVVGRFVAAQITKRW